MDPKRFYQLYEAGHKVKVSHTKNKSILCENNGILTLKFKRLDEKEIEKEAVNNEDEIEE